MELVTRTCKCGIVHRFGSTINCVKCRCGELVYGLCIPHHIPIPQIIPRWIRLVRMLRIPSDTGIGDTLQRQFAKFGGERFKQWAAKLGIDCGCTERQDHYNKKYPY